MTFEISIRRSIKADKEFVFDWWTDLSPDDTKLVDPLKKRTVLSRTFETILLHDEEELYFKRMKFDVKVTLHRPDSWISEYDGNDANATSVYTLSSTDDGITVLSYHSKIEPKGFLTNMFSPVIKPFIARVFAAEMKVFIRELEANFLKEKAIRRDRGFN